MLINNEKIEINHSLLDIGMDFFEVNKRISDVIYAKQIPDERGLGHIIVKNESFYDLFGTVIFYFQNGKMTQISITPEWNRYDLDDENGNRLTIDSAINRIATLSENGLRRVFGTEREKTKYGNLIFSIGNLCIVTTRARGGEQYSVVIK